MLAQDLLTCHFQHICGFYRQVAPHCPCTLRLVCRVTSQKPAALPLAHTQRLGKYAVRIDSKTRSRMQCHTQSIFRSLLSSAVDLSWVVRVGAEANRAQQGPDYRQLVKQLLLVGQANLATSIGAPHHAVRLFDAAKQACSDPADCLFATPGDLVQPIKLRNGPSPLTQAHTKLHSSSSCAGSAVPHVRASWKATGGSWPPELRQGVL